MPALQTLKLDLGGNNVGDSGAQVLGAVEVGGVAEVVGIAGALGVLGMAGVVTLLAPMPLNC